MNLWWLRLADNLVHVYYALRYTLASCISVSLDPLIQIFIRNQIPDAFPSLAAPLKVFLPFPHVLRAP
jgi:hypothetical protein